jgi:hypothetical protein
LIAINTYHPSGRISWCFPVCGLLVGLPAVAVLAFFYAIAFIMTPPVFLAPVVSVLFAVACSIAVKFVVSKGHSRSIAASTAMAVLLCLVFIWVHWMVIFAALNFGAMENVERFAFSNPWTKTQMLWEFAVTNHENNPRVLSPMARCIVWIFEVGLFMALTVFFACRETRKPYSETAHCWAKEEKMGELFPKALNTEALLEELAVQRIAPLLGMDRAEKLQMTAAALEWSTLKLTGYKVEGGSQEYWVDIDRVTHQRAKEGGVKKQNKNLIKVWILTHEEYAALIGHFNVKPDAESPEALSPA